MTDDVQTWHHGLIARWWAEFRVGGPEIPYFQNFIEHFGQPVLDVGCGAGRLLLPYRRAGLDVDGCDVSADMLAFCRRKAAEEGFEVQLYQQALHELDIPRRYRTIIACGALGLGGDRRLDNEALRRFYEHLEPGGALLLDNEVPYNDAWSWPYWLKEHHGELPMEYPPLDERRRASDGTDYGLQARLVALDPLEQTLTMQMRATQWHGDDLLAEEEHILKATMYFKNELLLMMEQAGFRDIAVYGDYTDEEAAPEHGFLVFVAKKER